MGLFDFLKPKDINDGIRTFAETDGALLLDVRTPQEFASGHIPGSLNLPLQDLAMSGEPDINIPSMDTPLFVYCRSGNRSGRAAMILEHMGYTSVKNIGGIIDYQGKTEA